MLVYIIINNNNNDNTVIFIVILQLMALENLLVTALFHFLMLNLVTKYEQEGDMKYTGNLIHMQYLVLMFYSMCTIFM